MTLGGKTGTGDNRIDTFARGGALDFLASG